MGNLSSDAQRSASICALFTPARDFLYYYVVGVIIFVIVCFASSTTGFVFKGFATHFVL